MPPTAAMTQKPNLPRAALKLPCYDDTAPQEPYFTQVSVAALQNGWNTVEGSPRGIGSVRQGNPGVAAPITGPATEL